MNGTPCGCGQKGCYEKYASANGLVLQTKKYLEDHPTESSSLRDLPELTAKTIMDAAKAGDVVADHCVNIAAEALGVCCVNLCRVLDPELIVFSGGLALAGDFLMTRLRSSSATTTGRSRSLLANLRSRRRARSGYHWSCCCGENGLHEVMGCVCDRFVICDNEAFSMCDNETIEVLTNETPMTCNNETHKTRKTSIELTRILLTSCSDPSSTKRMRRRRRTEPYPRCPSHGCPSTPQTHTECVQ